MLLENFNLNTLREPVLAGQTRPEMWRRLQLKRLESLIEDNENQILEALKEDLRKPPTEAFFEIVALKQELKITKQELKAWMKPKRVKVPLSLKPGEALVQLEPLGCILIIGPWNYPFSLTIQPLISALAAGNTAVLKPSEKAPATSRLISDLIPKYLPKEIVKVFEGDGGVAAGLLDLPFDHIFFTGSENIGKKILAAAAEHLTPVTLELGGKSPAIVLQSADLAITAKRLIWGKSLNAGQTCIAPDHLLVESEIKTNLINEMKTVLKNFFGPDPTESSSLARIINEDHFQRLAQLIDEARRKNQIIFGGQIDESRRRIAPTLIEIEDRNDPLMKEELFGPIFPVLTIKNIDDAISNIVQQARPLALYMFGGTIEEQKLILEKTSSGGVCFNDVVLQAGIPDLPFGGVGSSGMGRYHGSEGFKTFSNQKSILKRPFWLDINLRYPPYKIDLKILKQILG